MGKRRYKQLGMESFFGNVVYERAVPEDHFLRQLEGVVDWEVFGEQLVALYRGRAEEGRPPYDPVVLLKMLLLSYLYNISGRQVQAHVQDSLSAKFFLGLAVDEPAPDYTTLALFTRRIAEYGKERSLQALLGAVVAAARAGGVKFGSLQVVDSTHTVADVNTGKDDRRQGKEGKPPRDGDARWGCKHRRRMRNEEGKVVQQPEYFYGYKAHTSLNAEAEMITSVVVTGGNAPDGKQLTRLVRQDRAQGLPVETYAGDRGYDDTENHCYLESEGLHSAIKLNRYRTERKDGHEGVWVALQETAEYQAGQAERYKIERKYGEAKAHHGLRRCRYLGRMRYAIQAYMTAIVLNLKRMVTALTGATFRGRARVGLVA